MTPTDLAMLTKAMGPVIREFAAKEHAVLRAENAALVARVTALESQKALVPRDGRDGTSVTMSEMAPVIAAEVHKAVSALPRPENGVGKDAPAPDLDAIVSRVLALVPKPEKGDPGHDGKDAVSPDVDVIVDRVLARVPKPEKGDKGDPGTDGTSVHGKDGHSVTVDDVMPLIVREIEHRVAALPVAKDGAGFTGAVINREGHLVLTLSNGATQDVGLVIGKDGTPGLDGKDAIGIPGKDGKDGQGFDDFDLFLDETRGFVLRLGQGERVKEWVLPIPFYTGDYEPGKEYPTGASFAFDGSTWVVKHKTSAKPEQGSPLWWISSRRGKQGKEGKKGDPGTNGRDLTQMDPQTGRKW